MFFLTEFFFGVSCVKKNFGVDRVWNKKTLFQKKKAGKHKNHPTTAIATGGGEAYSPTDILGTSGTGKAMEPWREWWFLYSSPADGGNYVEHTHHDRKQKNAICPSGFGKRYQNDYIAAGATSYEAQARDTT